NLAEDILGRTELAGSIREQLNRQRCVFLFGNTAPDVQTISKQSREETHFFSLPIQPETPPPWEILTYQYPALASPLELASAQSAFLAGYLCHLLADWLWIKDIYAPVFGPGASWGSFHHRLVIHNVLRTYLDHQALSKLPPEAGACLAEVAPDRWLPFVEDVHLVEWRDFIARQLFPGAAAQTVEVFAGRAGISPQDFYRLLESEEIMEQEVFAHIPYNIVIDFQRNLVYESINLLNTYFSGTVFRRMSSDP
ncbi:MAG: zinc dependent phospholipase C family protein, partial [Omnitrophica WOR_2 bacterium]